MLLINQITSFDTFKAGSLLRNIFVTEIVEVDNRTIIFSVNHIVCVLNNEINEISTLVVFDRFNYGERDFVNQSHIRDFLSSLKMGGETIDIDGVLVATFTERIIHTKLFELDNNQLLLVIDEQGFGYVWQFNVSEWSLVNNFNLINLDNNPLNKVHKITYDTDAHILLWHERTGVDERRSDDSPLDDQYHGDLVKFCNLVLQHSVQRASKSTNPFDESPPEIIPSAIGHAYVIFSLPAGSVQDIHLGCNGAGCWVVTVFKEILYYDFSACQITSIDISSELSSTLGPTEAAGEPSTESKLADHSKQTTASFLTAVADFNAHISADGKCGKDSLLVLDNTGSVVLVEHGAHQLTVSSCRTASQMLDSVIKAHADTTKCDLLSSVDVAFESLLVMGMAGDTANLCVVGSTSSQTNGADVRLPFCCEFTHSFHPVDFPCSELFPSCGSGVDADRSKCNSGWHNRQLVSKLCEPDAAGERSACLPLPAYQTKPFRFCTLHRSGLPNIRSESSESVPAAFIVSNVLSSSDSILGDGFSAKQDAATEAARDSDVLAVLSSGNQLLTLSASSLPSCNTVGNTADKFSMQSVAASFSASAAPRSGQDREAESSVLHVAMDRVFAAAAAAAADKSAAAQSASSQGIAYNSSKPTPSVSKPGAGRHRGDLSRLELLPASFAPATTAAPCPSPNSAVHYGAPYDMSHSASSRTSFGGGVSSTFVSRDNTPKSTTSSSVPGSARSIASNAGMSEYMLSVVRSESVAHTEVSPSPTGTVSGVAAADSWSDFNLSLANIDSFLDTCLADYHAIVSPVPEPSPLVQQEEANSNPVVGETGPLPLQVPIPVVISGCESVSAVDEERDAELDAILRRYLSNGAAGFNNTRVSSEKQWAAGEFDAGVTELAQAKRNAAGEWRGVSSSTPQHWLDTLDLVSLAPSSTHRLTVYRDNTVKGVNETSSTGEMIDEVVVSTEEAIFDLIGPFKFMEIVTALGVVSTEDDLNSGDARPGSLWSRPGETKYSDMHKQQSNSDNTGSSESNYTLDLMFRRLLFSNPTELAAIVLYLEQLERDAAARHQIEAVSTINSANIDNELNEVSFSCEESTASVAVGVTHMRRPHVQHPQLNAVDSDDVSDDDKYADLFREVGDSPSPALHEHDSSTLFATCGDADTVMRPVSPPVNTPTRAPGKSAHKQHAHRSSVKKQRRLLPGDGSDSDGDEQEYSFFKTVSSDDESDSLSYEQEDSFPAHPDPTDHISSDEEDDHHHELMADLAPLSRRVSDSSPFQHGTLSPVEMYKRMSFRETRIDSFTNMLHLESEAEPLQRHLEDQHGLVISDKPVGNDANGLSEESAGTSTEVAGMDIGSVSPGAQTVRGALQCVTGAIVAFSISLQRQPQQPVILSNEEVDADAAAAGSHFARLTEEQQECLLQILFLCGAHMLAVDAMVAWGRLDLLILLSLRMSASANYVTAHCDVHTAHDDFSCSCESECEPNWQQDYFQTGRGRFDCSDAFHSRPPLPPPITTIPEWSSAVGSGWDLELDGGDDETSRGKGGAVFHSFLSGSGFVFGTSSAGSLLPFAERRVSDAAELFAHTFDLCMRSGATEEAKELVRWRPKRVSKRYVEQLMQHYRSDVTLCNEILCMCT